MQIFTIGAGFVSSHLNYPIISERINCNDNSINHILDTYKPDVLINCIGRTGNPNIDQCEQIKEETAITNTTIPILLAEACNKKDIRLIQISSGCIYFGQSPNYDPSITSYILDTGWKETDYANPQSYYSKSKWACDLALGDMNNVCSLRIRMPISDKNHPRNLIDKLRNYKQIVDIPNSMTFMKDLTRCIEWSIANNKTGIYHCTNPDPLTATQIMREYQKYIPDHQFEVINQEQLNRLTIATRSNCLLDTSKIAQQGFSFSPSEEALQECMSLYIQNLGKGK